MTLVVGTTLGTRLNRRNYFKGAVLIARFTCRALAPGQFLTVPLRGKD